MNLEDVLLTSELDTKGQILYDPTEMRYQEQSNSDRKSDNITGGWREGAKGVILFNRYRVSLGKTKKFRGWMVVMIAQHCEGT